jgi:hypothetical protein
MQRPPPPLAYPPPPQSETKAIASLVLGILSLTCLGIFAGIPALVIGSLARRDIDRSQGRLTGRGLAAGGIVTGLFGTGLSLVIGLSVLGGALEAANEAPAPEPRAEVPGTRSYGSLDVVDLDQKRALKAQIADLVRSASTKGRVVVLQTYVTGSKECAQVAAALPDPRMQKALANVTLVRVDIKRFSDELESMRIETKEAPWFYMLDAAARPMDAISADEWDENVAENMAPVLGAFVKGELGRRKTPSPIGTAL